MVVGLQTLAVDNHQGFGGQSFKMQELTESHILGALCKVHEHEHIQGQQ